VLPEEMRTSIRLKQILDDVMKTCNRKTALIILLLTLITVLPSSAEIYDPATGAFTAAGDMTRIPHKHEAVLVADGRLLIIGGSDERDGNGAYVSAEIYDPEKRTFSATGNMNSPRYKLQGTVVLLSNGKVLVAGGANRAEVFDPSANTFSYVAGDMETPRLFATATRLNNGQVLITGGYHGSVIVTSNAWVYRG
jgi:N-acetylneuraminic acid mutarotase